jgi:hypothetical protein
MFKNHYQIQKNNERQFPIVDLTAFSHENVNEAFGLTQDFKNSELLEKWLKRAKSIEISTEEKAKLTALQDKLLIYGKAWNVQELKERFISPMTESVNFYDFEAKYGSFSNRYMETILQNTVVRGKVDWIVATGQYQPKQPFVFLNTHTYENSGGIDPVGQLIATLYIAKVLSQKPVKPSLFNPKPKVYSNIPLYGMYIIGSLWYFVRLKGNRYYISPAYDATYTEELHNIFRMLKSQRLMIHEIVTNTRITAEQPKSTAI